MYNSYYNSAKVGLICSKEKKRRGEREPIVRRQRFEYLRLKVQSVNGCLQARTANL